MNEEDREIVTLVLTWYSAIFIIWLVGLLTLGQSALLCGISLAVIVAGVIIKGKRK